MFQAKKAFKGLERKSFSTFEELDSALRELHRANIRALSPSFGVRELFEFAQRKGWVVREGNTVRFVVT